ncbi:metallophosphoesterase [uncultured Acetatifactor sp.]|uniref:metallophosphoesterase family protein n=1 Tax=uncultured Acetatifactor sp. TaxID=1671927 RepID=UPI00263340F9|nr:metallophosphoesterase [uncultured Acetatifactor sp.]
MLQRRAIGHAFAVICLLGLAALTGCGNAGEGGQKEGTGGGAWEKHITEETVQLKGIEGEYTLLFLTDTHAIVQSQGASEQEAANEEARYPTFFNEEGVPSAEQFPEWIRYANENGVDAVLLGGDIIDTPSEANLRWLEEQLGQLDMPYLYVNGNHDWTYPWEYMTEAGKEAYLPLLEPFMQDNTVIHSLDFGEFTVVGIDDSPGQVEVGVFPAYEEILAEGRPVIVLAHVPFMTQSVLGKAREAWSSPVVIGAGNYGGIYPNEDSERFVSRTTAASSPVELVLAGHVHFYDRDVIEGEKQVLQLVGGAGFRGEAILIHITGGE